jgi:hypothetical protein
MFGNYELWGLVAAWVDLHVIHAGRMIFNEFSALYFGNHGKSHNFVQNK